MPLGHQDNCDLAPKTGHTQVFWRVYNLPPERCHPSVEFVFVPNVWICFPPTSVGGVPPLSHPIPSPSNQQGPCNL